MAEKELTKAQAIGELTKSPHGELTDYLPVGPVTHQQDPEFYAHLIAWNQLNGEIRDAKVALPVFALRGPEPFVENALAHLAMLDPRNFVRALDFARDVKAPSRLLRRLVERYLRDREQNWLAWEGTALQHRGSFRTLYARYHIVRDSKFGIILFGGERGGPKLKPPSGKFAVLAQLLSMSPEEIAGAITEHKIPFLIARGALGAKAKDPDVLLALIKRMSATELVTNTKALERLGIKDVPALRAAFEAGLEKVSKSTRGAVLKTTRAAEVIDDEQLAQKLHATQERQLDRMKGIEGRWLVLGDKSGSMHTTIEASRHIAGTLARLVRGEVHLIFFDQVPYYKDVSGKTYEQIKEETQYVFAGGSTSIGCGVRYLLDKKIEVDGIAIVSDGGENQLPVFAAQLQQYREKLGIDPTVYFYKVVGTDRDVLSHNCAVGGIDLQTFDLTHGVDYYSLPNLVQTMRVGRYQLLDDILATPLRRLDEVLTRTTGMEVQRHVRTASAV